MFFDHKRIIFIGIALVVLLAHLILLTDFPLLWQAVAALLLAGGLPGLLFIEWLLGASLTREERTLYSIGAGYSLMVVVMLLLSYLPGPVSRWQTFVAFDVVLVLLSLLCYRGRKGRGKEVMVAKARQALHSSYAITLAGGLSLLLVGGFFRLVTLDYAEFQGDEARAALRAAAVIQGYEDVLLIHRKGPTEILLPTVIYSLTGHLTEQMARLPFALANLTALFALFLLGWRLFGPIAGWTAAILLALDGYMIAFARIVQYQSIVFLMTVLVILLLYPCPESPPSARWRRALFLAALFLATGLLSHYEAIFAVIPATYLLAWSLIRQFRTQKSQQPFLLILALLRVLLPPILIGGILLASFYIPFILHPNFSDTYTYLAERRIGGNFPYNNLTDFFIRSTLYSTTYYLILLIGLATIALIAAYRRANRYGWVVAIPIILNLSLTALNPTWLTIGGTDYTVVFFALVLLPLILLPRLTPEARSVWLWFSIPMLIAFFFTQKPRTHVYVFFIPWALLAGMMIERGFEWLKKQVGNRVALMTSVGLVTVAVLVFGSYAYWYFIYHEVQVLRTWHENRPAGFWTIYDEAVETGIFGFPFANGWKVVGMLYQEGIITGNYATNEPDPWLPAWYTRGQNRCAADAEWFFQAAHLDEFGEFGEFGLSERGFHEWGRIEINGLLYMTIHQRTNKPLPPRTIQRATWEAAFDQDSSPDFPLNPPVVFEPLRLDFGHFKIK